jgi:hypothetical protein
MINKLKFSYILITLFSILMTTNNQILDRWALVSILPIQNFLSVKYILIAYLIMTENTAPNAYIYIITANAMHQW